MQLIDTVPLEGVDAIIHRSSVANDPCGDLDPKLTWEVSRLATMHLADIPASMGSNASFTPCQTACTA